ncbi:anthocyanidin reductase ((2S)-flavan-3-ol-forming)-like [Abrus precatorius]|uniref:Anthocyanidin reductase ((2S)-flavan-3-ol-forming)-like n=1 Tax=Abrus precatorius TaxID=3816 RepID=A0A8B8LCQ9_ABRPR|nr:anthocyanidin reductase ((2S)-flavan-3-ol-forming)-like [Abrus precatorius]
MEKRCKVCVTGGSGYIGSWLVKKLLAKGYTVHATLRDLKIESEVDLLKSLPQSEEQLVLFEADIYNPIGFEPAIQGCEFVFHLATPLIHQPNSQQYKDTSEASVAAAKSIAMFCLKAGTVRRLIYTASVCSASPLKDDGSGFKDVMDETCWTPLNDSLEYLFLQEPVYKDYTYSKTMTEKHLLSYGTDENGGGLEVVTLACGLVGGDTLHSSIPGFGSGLVCIAQIIQNERVYKSLKFLENLMGKIPLAHVDDVCEAHIFCMENTSMNGRFLCASSYVSLQEMANLYALHHPEFNVKQENEDGLKKDIKWVSTKLCDKGFVYRYNAKMILDDCIKCARRMGAL